MMARPFSTAELMACVVSRALRDGEVALTGAVNMIPVSGCRLAQLTHAPSLTFIHGGSGGVNSQLAPLTASSCDAESLRAEARLSLQEIVALACRGRVDVFFGGGIQIDQHGNCNMVCVGPWHAPRFRGPGSLGLPYTSQAGRTIIYTTAHTPRTFVPRVDFMSGVGYLDGGASRAQAGPPGGGPSLVVSNLAVLDFEPETRRLRVCSLHPGVEAAEVKRQTGFPLVMPDPIPSTPAPTPMELRLLRRLDPRGLLRRLA
ncbi:MAG: CoA synthetase [Deltaproteobacteria bacterium]|nr:CoA synthetase [Deltaproteobacteria bacterium]